MVMPKRKRHNKQQAFYATRDGKVYAANRKARRAAISNKIVVKEETTLTNNPVDDTLSQGVNNASNDTTNL